MRFRRPYREPDKCEWVFQPGELVLSTFDGQQCSQEAFLECSECGGKFCSIMGHYWKHIESEEKH